MTQLVELQAALPKFADADIRLYAISYDELGALEEFAHHHSITYDLLADSGWNLIRQFGILNHHVTEDQVPFHGIPFPGTYLVDEDGVVMAKAFHRSLAQRESAEGLIDAALGEILLGSEEPIEHTGDSGIRFSLTYHGGGGVLRGGTLRRLVVRDPAGTPRGRRTPGLEWGGRFCHPDLGDRRGRQPGARRQPRSRDHRSRHDVPGV